MENLVTGNLFRRSRLRIWHQSPVDWGYGWVVLLAIETFYLSTAYHVVQFSGFTYIQPRLAIEVIVQPCFS